MPKIVDHDVRRDDIARAAFRVIRRKGVARATIRDIARESGCSVGAVVHYIPSKDHIFLQAAEYSTHVIRGRMESAEAANSGLEALRQVLYQGLPAGDDMLGHWKIWFGFWQLSETSELIRAATHDRYGESYRRYGRLIRAAQKSGEIRPDINVADATASLICQMDGMGVHTLISGHKLSTTRLRRQIDAWIDRTLLPASTKAKGNVLSFSAAAAARSR
ncbi:MAG: TetR/AcrR family transcriptional regulator [Proteobacteria bacterium]|nr:TetR/AcrR family transcriptional regulator [Pseudomonadota bacterium]